MSADGNKREELMEWNNGTFEIDIQVLHELVTDDFIGDLQGPAGVEKLELTCAFARVKAPW